MRVRGGDMNAHAHVDDGELTEAISASMVGELFFLDAAPLTARRRSED